MCRSDKMFSQNVPFETLYSLLTGSFSLFHMERKKLAKHLNTNKHRFDNICFFCFVFYNSHQRNCKSKNSCSCCFGGFSENWYERHNRSRQLREKGSDMLSMQTQKLFPRVNLDTSSSCFSVTCNNIEEECGRWNWSAAYSELAIKVLYLSSQRLISQLWYTSVWHVGGTKRNITKLKNIFFLLTKILL